MNPTLNHTETITYWESDTFKGPYGKGTESPASYKDVDSISCGGG